MSNENMQEKSVTENKVNLQWGQREILGVKMENLQMTADKILREIQAISSKQNMMSDKERRTPHLYANAIIEDTSDSHLAYMQSKKTAYVNCEKIHLAAKRS